MPTYTLVGTAAGANGTGSLTPTMPTYAEGDLAVYLAYARVNTETITPPSGYSALEVGVSGSGNSGSIGVYGKICTASETAQSVSFSGSGRHAAVMSVLRSSTGWPAIGDIVVNTTEEANTITTARANAITPAENDCCVLAVCGKGTTTNDITDVATPTSYTDAAEYIFNNASTGVVLSAWFLGQTTAAAVSDENASLTGGSNNTTTYQVSIALRGEGSAAPAFSAVPAISSETATAYTVGFTSDSAATVYGVAVAAGDTAPSVAQVKAGQNNAGTTAKAANSKAVTGVDTLVLTPSDAPPAATYDLYFVLNNANGDSARAALTGKALDAPAFTVPATVTSQTATVYTLGFTPDAACDIYAVAVIAGSTAPSIAQIKAGQNGAGAAAKAANDKAITGADTLTLTPSDSPAFPRYDLYCVLSGNTGDSARRTLASEYLDAPTGYSFTTLTSLLTTSPFYGTGAAIADTVVVETATTPDAYVVSVAVDGTVSYAAGGDDSRQIVGTDVYDYSAGAYLGAGTLVFNNLAPIPGDSAFLEPLLYRKDVAITALNLAALVPDPDLDTVTVTALDALPTGLSVTAGELIGTPTVYGQTETEFEWEDQYGAAYTETATIQVGELVPDVIGNAQATAVSAIEAVASLTTSVTTASSASVTSGNVISTDPVAGTLVPYDEVIAVVVSSGSSLTITTTTLADGTRDVSYSAALAANGVVTTWSVDAGSLPTGLTLDNSTGIISGTPTVAGAYAFTIGATNGAASDTQALTLTIDGIAPTITTTSLTRAIEGEAYSAQLAATGDATITYAVTTGELPAGLSLSTSGAITGTPTGVESQAFTVTATNSQGSDTQALGLSVVAPSVGYVLTLKPLRNRINLRRRHDA